MKHSIIYLCISILCAASCVKENFEINGEPGKGECEVSADMRFIRLSASLGSTRTAGDAIGSIESLCVLLYDKDGKFVGKYPIADYDVTGTGEADKQAPDARFKMTIPYGRYYIYAVANMGNLDGYDIQTMDKLKGISLSWKDNVQENNDMFGHFCEKGKVSGEPPLVTINRKNTALEAWVRRTVSKVTVAFDGSNLEEGVFVYIKSVQVKDIPNTCLLGSKNTVKEKGGLIAEGEKIVYGTGSNYDETWPVRITKGKAFYPAVYRDGEYFLDENAHSDTQNALFFYENMQGKGNDKRQDTDNNGKPDHPGLPDDDTYLSKDGKDFGTYIEVKAYYRSINHQRIGNGDITFRFMLGKDVIDDYDAERNYHYKLTLKFNRFANDADWHIEYKEEVPSIQVPDQMFISYLYNHEATLPLKINCGQGYVLDKLEAQIDTNSWAPYGAPKNEYYYQLDPNVTKGAPTNPWNGFLSLRKTRHTIIDPYTGYDGKLENANTYNESYYNGHKRGERTYFSDGKLNESDSNEEDGRYELKIDSEDGAKSYIFNVPIYTRAKQLLTNTGYTGNNPFVAYRRKAVIRFKATLKSTDGTSESKIIEQNSKIFQVIRVVNPKGVWRKADNDKPFHVVLKHIMQENAEEFTTFVSEGEWKASVVLGDKDFITLDGKEEVHGSTGTPVDFWIKFNGTIAENESRCAIIRVEYHNYNCVHLIFVRQGKVPLQMLQGEKFWHTCNMKTRTQEASCPLEEGSMFRFGNWDQPIDATSNIFNDFNSSTSLNLNIAGTEGPDGQFETIKWADIGTQNMKDGSFSPTTVEGKTVHVASYTDYEALWQSDDIEQGYGVLYGNDATETLSKVDDVYGHRYDRHGNENSEGAGYGMRGVFVYNTSTTSGYGGRHIFFPLGTTGYGRRKDAESWKRGVLRYANSIQELTLPEYRPLLKDLYIRHGAVYWLEKLSGQDTRGKESLGWDFNYYTFDFNYVGGNSLFTNNNETDNKRTQSDACFIRCVED